MVKSEADKLREVIVCKPGNEYFNVKDLDRNNIRELSDPDIAELQHDELTRIMRGYGCKVYNIEELKGHPNSIFVRDTAVFTPDGYIKLRMGLESRRGEEKWIADFLDSRGEVMLDEIVEPGTVEGGDIILAGNVVFLGYSGRTNTEGIRQISRILRRMKYETRVIDVPEKYLHLGGAMSLTGQNCVLCCEDIYDTEVFEGFEIIEIESSTFISCNVITLDEKNVIVSSDNSKVIEKLLESDFKIHKIDLSEFAKGTGGPTCLILPVSRG